MTEQVTRKAYLALFNLLDSRFDKTKDGELGRLLSGMNPNMFVDDASADSACYEDFCEFSVLYKEDNMRDAYRTSVDFLNLYCNEFGFDIKSIVENITLDEYVNFFENANR